MIKLEIWDYVKDVKIDDVWADAVPRKDEEIVLEKDADHWLYVNYVCWISTNGALEPRVYVNKRPQPNP